ncbi:hypothetical protein [Luteolibacter marinus]|uniref:hypothetical protein n=1 Tax=Luteolibacter marinus TaxID=2776705 RepID=UPI0018683418|nr:hypothetical protein [Luteolibacter marinus]
MSDAQIILLAILGGGLASGWILARWLEKRYNRDLDGDSEEILDEMEMVMSPRRGLEIRTRCKNLQPILQRISDRTEAGFGERQARLLAKRISRRGQRGCERIRFFVRLNGCRSDLEIQWSRDGSDRVRLLVFAAPSIIRALKRHDRGLVPVPGMEHTVV